MKNLGLLLLLIFALVVITNTPSISNSTPKITSMKKNPVPEDPPTPKNPPKGKDGKLIVVKG